MTNQFRCVIHGSFSKHFTEIQRVNQVFAAAGITVLAPQAGELVYQSNGFGLFQNEQNTDPRLVELLYLNKLKHLGLNGFSYFVNPNGYIGASTAYELAIAQLTNVPCFFSDKLIDHPAYTQRGSQLSAETLAEYIARNQALPPTFAAKNDAKIYQLWRDLFVPGSVVATGAIIEYRPRRKQTENEILLVKTHKWGNRYSIVGGKVQRGERLNQALLREVKEETMLNGQIGRHICTFDQIKNSGYYKTNVQHIFVDNVVAVSSKKVTLNHEAQDYLWALPSEALRHLNIEPNARTTIELYQNHSIVK